jgi:acyl-CoA synthetase (AMP-forming)/AMP-acid ligase II
LSSLGIWKADRFVIDLLNSPELVIGFLALAKLGAITTWCNPMYRKKEVGFILRNSGARGILHGCWNDPKETRRQCDRDGWFHSGDLGVMDKDG